MDEENLKQLDEFQEATFFFIRMLLAVDDGDLSKATVSFEGLESLLSAYEAGDNHTLPRLIDAFPSPSWREDTIPVPVAFLRPLVLAWQHYKNIEPEQNKKSKKLFSQVLGIDGSGQGKDKDTNKLKELNRDAAMAHAVAKLKRSDPNRSLEDISFEVAEQFDMGDGTVSNAMAKYRDMTRKLKR